MDPLTQGALGAALAQAVLGERLGRRTWWLGALGGMAPDLDVLIRSGDAPLLELEYHRHFTHSLAFIPIGGLLVALPFVLLQRGAAAANQRMLIIAATTIGWATHGLLDATTSYGTMLWWPFSHVRVALNWISVIDPIYTLALIVGVIVAARRSDRLPMHDLARRRAIRRPALLGFAFASLYMLLGVVQHARAGTAQAELAARRGHAVARGRVDPLLGNDLLWRSTYLDTKQILHADVIVVPWWSSVRVHEGESIEGIVIPTAWPAPADASPRQHDLALFAWFADDLLYSPQPGTICDGRYSGDPGGFTGMFCVRVGPQGVHAFERNTPRDAGRFFAVMGELLGGGAPL
jgi:inner membrane protein